MNPELTFEFFGLDFGDLAEIADESKKHFDTVKLTRILSPPAASPLFGEFSVVLVIVSVASAAIAKAFFEELGKDLYKQFLRLAASAAQKCRVIRDNRGGFSIGIRSVVDGVQCTFAFMNPPTSDLLLIAISKIPSVLEGVPHDRDVFAVYDENRNEWFVEIASEEIMEVLRRVRNT